MVTFVPDLDGNWYLFEVNAAFISAEFSSPVTKSFGLLGLINVIICVGCGFGLDANPETFCEMLPNGPVVCVPYTLPPPKSCVNTSDFGLNILWLNAVINPSGLLWA